jgi:hypothetical protein
MIRTFAIFLLALVATPSSGFPQDMPRPDSGSSSDQSPTSQQSPPPTATSGRPEAQPSAKQLRENWRQLMLRTPTPETGCYTSAFPSTEWQGVPCSTEPARPHPRLFIPQTLGGGNDVSALVTGSLTSATGSLLQVIGVTDESDPGGQNSHSLQLNTNNFNSAALCAGQVGCVGWQQFIRDNPGSVYIQYWLINHGSPCPANPANFSDSWHFFAGAPGQSPGCFINGNQTSVPTQDLQNLEGMRVTGNTSLAAQSVAFGPAGDQIYTATDNGDLLAIGTQWNQAEFNIFGLCCGNQATFNAGSTIVVQIAVNNGTATPPSSSSTGFTAETNNLNLVSPTCPIGGQAPAIVFTENFNVFGDTSTCGNDQFYLPGYNSPLAVTQGSSGFAFLIMAGPWVAADLGENATGTILGTSLPPGSRAFTDPGHKDNLGHAYGLMELSVSVPLSANPGSYTVTVQGQDVGSGAAVTTNVPIQVAACTPTTTCDQRFGLCGPISNGCGGTIDCGVCTAGLFCSSSHCCPSGDFYNTSSNVCQPTSCPAGTSYCFDLGDCATTKECQRAGGHCTGRQCQ